MTEENHAESRLVHRRYSRCVFDLFFGSAECEAGGIVRAMEILFTLLAERYERRSVPLTSNLAFSKWDQVFKDTITTAAAIDRLVHHSVIVELSLHCFWN